MEAQLVKEEVLFDEKDLPEHLIGIADEPWALWRCVCLRSAGFPVAQILDLAAPNSVAAANEVFEAEEQLDQARRHALEILERALDNAGSTERGPILDIVVRVKRGKPPKSFDGTSELGTALTAIGEATAKLKLTQNAYLEKYLASLTDVSHRLLGIVQDERLLEAVIWQNREAFHTGIERLASMPITPAPPSSSRRTRERLVTNYLQRYSTKNDSIGFFGPLGWASFVPEGEVLTVLPGAEFLEAREVFFEGWALDAFAAALAKEPGLQSWIAPRLFSYVYFDGQNVQLPLEKPVKLPRNFATLLRACDGERPAKEIAADLLRNHPETFRNETEIYTLLETLRQRGVVEWTLEVPWTLEFPQERLLQDNLRRVLNRIGDDGLRERLLTAVDEFDSARLRLAEAAGDYVKVDEALGQLAEIFTQLTGAAATRSSGQTYAGRTLVYEDCRRDVKVELGPEIFKEIAGPLPLLLESARWFTHEVAQAYRELFSRSYRDLSEASGVTAVDGATFWLTVQPYFFDPKYRLVDTLVPGFQQRWEEVLMLPDGLDQVHYRSAELRERVRDTFAAPKAGWPFARYHSPDLMIAATNEEAIRRGDYQIVLGELHIGMNTLGSILFLSMHPNAEELFRSLEIDIPETRLVPVTPKGMVTSRNQPVFISQKDFRLELTRDPSSVPRSKALSIGSLVVEEIEGQLCIRTRDHSLRFDILDAFADVLSALTINSLKLLRPAKHTPRVSFDRLIVCRETWRFTPAEIEFAFVKDDRERFLAARRWMRKHSLPRFVFTKTPIEIKPTYLDFDSPILIEMFAKTVRQSAEANDGAVLISMSEMIPNHEQIWLPDAHGNRYTSEFRIVAVDQMR